MSFLRTAGILTIAVAAAASVASSGSVAGTNLFLVNAQILTHSIHFKATYWVRVPANCPEFEPDINDPDFDAQFTAWTSSACDSYRGQNADLILRLYRGGHLIWSEDERGFGDVLHGGKWSGYLYQYVTDYKCGSYRWRLTLLDPYGSANRSQTGMFYSRCR